MKAVFLFALIAIIAALASAQFFEDPQQLYATPSPVSGTTSYVTGNFSCTVECANIKYLKFIWPDGNKAASVSLQFVVSRAGGSPGTWKGSQGTLDLLTNQYSLTPITSTIISAGVYTISFYITIEWTAPYYSAQNTAFTTVDTVMQVYATQGMS